MNRLTFDERKRANATVRRVDNSKLFAGSPMHYYCRLCGEEMILVEDHMQPAPWYCDACIRDGLAKSSREVA